MEHLLEGIALCVRNRMEAVLGHAQNKKACQQDEKSATDEDRQGDLAAADQNSQQHARQ